MVKLGWALLALVAAPFIAIELLGLYRALRVRLAWRRIEVVGKQLVRELETDELDAPHIERRVDQIRRELDVLEKAKAEWL